MSIDLTADSNLSGGVAASIPQKQRAEPSSQRNGIKSLVVNRKGISMFELFARLAVLEKIHTASVLFDSRIKRLSPVKRNLVGVPLTA